jgi:hypothetical protein
MTARLHILVLVVGAIAFSMVPQWFTGVPLEHQLSSDAEFYVAGMEASMEPMWRVADTSFPIDIRPRGELVVTDFLATGARSLGIPLSRASVWLSIVAFVVFVLGVYALGRESAMPASHALALALVLIVPVHSLGGTTLGFQALGLLPRDAALAIAVWLLWLYVRAARRRDGRLLVLVGALSGLLANFQSIVAAHLILTIGLAEVIRRRSLSRALIGCALAFALVASPAIVDAFDKGLTSSPVDLAIMRLRLGYMLATPIGEALTHYLRRFLFYIPLLVLLWRFTRRRADQGGVGAVWWSIAISAALLAIAGVILETATVHAKYMVSRTSVYFMLAAMVLLLREVPRLAPQRRYGSTAAVVLVLAVFLLQSNTASVYRYVRQIERTRDERAELLSVAQRLQEKSRPNELFIAPSTESSDTAAMLRVYAARPTFVCYKDGGVALVDGARGRRWLDMQSRLDEALSSPDGGTLLRWMQAHQVTLAVLPRQAPSASARLNGFERIHEGARYVVLLATSEVL